MQAKESGAEAPVEEASPDAGEEGAVVLTVDHRFKRRTGKEVQVRLENVVVEVRKFVTSPAYIRRGYGLTLNQGDFNSARIDVSITVPCYLEDVELADEWAANFVEERLKREVDSLGKSGGRTTFATKEGSPL